MALSIYGTQLGNFPQLAQTLPLPEYLAGFEAWFSVNGTNVFAPLYYVSPGQVNIQIPYEIPSGQVTLNVGNPYQNVTYTLNIAQAAPGIFVSTTVSSVRRYSSASRGQATTLYITGEGQVQPALPTGTSPASGNSLGQAPPAAAPRDRHSRWRTGEHPVYRHPKRRGWSNADQLPGARRCSSRRATSDRYRGRRGKPAGQADCYPIARPHGSTTVTVVLWTA